MESCSPPPPSSPSTPTPSSTDVPERPVVRLKPNADRRLRGGHPWIYANEIVTSAETRAAARGGLVIVEAADGARLGVAGFNPGALIAGRMLAADPAANIDAAFFAARFRRAAALRHAFYEQPFGRLIHAEADGLPGVAIDRYGPVFNVQLNAAWAERARGPLIDALTQVFDPEAIVLRNDSDARGQEGLGEGVEVIKGAVDGPTPLVENDARFFADLRAGQKTGWFFDQRENRRHIAGLASGQSVLDVYCYAGGFGVLSAVLGAADVTLVDRSERALALASQAGEANGVAQAVATDRSEAFRFLESAAKDGRRWGVVICDPPAFAKTKKDKHAAQKAYRKLARLAAQLVAPEGFLLLGSCSHHVDETEFARACGRGLAQAGRSARLLRVAGAGPDHPRHPFLDESGYLKTLTYALD